MSLIIAAAQSASVPGDVSRNVANHLRFATAAAEHGVQLLVFPELSLTGYELSLARSAVVAPDSPALDPLRHLAREARMAIVVGAPLLDPSGGLHIAAIVLLPDGLLSTYAKQYVHESEQAVFTSGSGGPALAIGDATVALAICADARRPEHAAAAARRQANVYAVSAMVGRNDYPGKVALLERYAIEHRMAVLLANYSGASGGLVSAGGSAIWSEDGELVAEAHLSQEALVIGRKQNNLWSGMVVPMSVAAPAHAGA